MKTVILLALCCGLFSGCQTDNSKSSRVPATPESLAKRVEQLNLQLVRVEQIAAHWPLSSPKYLDSIHAMRDMTAKYLPALSDVRAQFAAKGIVLDEEYYRGQEQFVDGISQQLQEMEYMMSKNP